MYLNTDLKYPLGKVTIILLGDLCLVGRSLKDRRVVIRVSDPQHHQRPPHTVVLRRGHSKIVLKQPINFKNSKGSKQILDFKPFTKDESVQ